jgi:response regulator NasT
VEDEALIGLGLAEELTKAGHRVVGPVVSTGSALILAESQQPTLALIDLDLRRSPDAGELARSLKDALGIESILLASQPQQAQRYADVAVGVIAKPFDVAEIPAAVEAATEVLAGGEPPPPPIPAALRLFG